MEFTPPELSSVLVSALLAAGVAALVANVLVPLVGEVAVALRALDHPGGRRSHARPVARLGGLAILAGLIFGVGPVSLMEWEAWGSPLPTPELVALLMGTGMVFLVGMVDDVCGVPVWKKFLVQAFAACLIVSLGERWQFEVLGLPGGGQIELGMTSAVLTVLWIIGVTNALNLIDGLDGLATGVAAIIAGSFFAFSLLLDNPFIVVLMGGVVGSCLGFLPHNREPAKIFMGDAGSLTLGFLLATSSVHTGLKSPTAVAILVPLLALGVPVIDTMLVMVVRFIERPHGRAFHRVLRMFHADRNHLHHLLEGQLRTQRRAVRSIYALVGLSSLMALWVALTKSATLGLVLVVVEVVVIALVRHSGLARRAREVSLRRRREIGSDVESDEIAVGAASVAIPAASCHLPPGVVSGTGD